MSLHAYVKKRKRHTEIELFLLHIIVLRGSPTFIFLFLVCYSGEGIGTPLQYSCLENPMGGGAWWAAVHEVAKSRTRLSNFPFTFHFHALEKEMATHSSVLAWRNPGTGKPGGLLSIGSYRVEHNWSNLAAAAAAVCYREEGESRCKILKMIRIILT